jgi:peptide/nickel transport system permease protein
VHLLRLLAPLLIVNATLLIGDAIFLLSSLSFLGLGVQPPQTSWGGLLQAAAPLLPLNTWWLILPPCLMVIAALLATALLGQALRPRWDARQ